MEAIFTLLFLAFMLWVIWQLFALVGDMAERRGQDRLLWQVAALFINPFGAIVLLWLFVSVRENL
ncbi:hypothetical protein [uncultured Ruegeria sp.]|uniref:hypothetical protein n=1 Tax=uncultured Ruegeria sp. TaxID=259304 RepID=UPI0026319BEE|nr:hypothetical protein [uncultured Ruegeria sp.]